MKYTLKQLKVQATAWVNHNSCILGGIDHEGFPRHHFAGRHLPAAIPLYVAAAGLDQWKHGAFRYRKNSDTFSLELVTKGEFLIECDNQIHRVPEGSLFFVHHHRDSSMTCTTEYAEKRTVILRGSLLDHLLMSLHLNECAFLKLRNVAGVEDEMRQIENLLISREKESLHKADVEAYALLLQLAEEKGKILPEAMQKLLDYVHLHLDRTITANELAKISGSCVSTVQQMFRQYCHCTPLIYVTQCRMNAAEEMLNSGEYTIKEISSALGYQNQFYFSSVFRKYHGFPPSEFRKTRNKISAQ